jgi:hypothetical protein
VSLSGLVISTTVELMAEGQRSGVALATRMFHIMRWAEARMIELRSYLDGDEARRDYKRLSVKNN